MLFSAFFVCCGELRQQGPATEIHLCVSSCELRVASPAHARAFVQPVALKFISAPARMGHGLKRARMDFVLWPQAELRLQGLDKTKRVVLTKSTHVLTIFDSPEVSAPFGRCLVAPGRQARESLEGFNPPNL